TVRLDGHHQGRTQPRGGQGLHGLGDFSCQLRGRCSSLPPSRTCRRPGSGRVGAHYRSAYLPLRSRPGSSQPRCQPGSLRRAFLSALNPGPDQGCTVTGTVPATVQPVTEPGTDWNRCDSTYSPATRIRAGRWPTTTASSAAAVACSQSSTV